MKTNYITLILAFFFSFLHAQSQITRDTIIHVPSLGKIMISPDHTWTSYRFNDSNDSLIFNKMSCDSMLLSKYVRNRGEGNQELSGARNLRTVLKGIVYRGGGNNKYNAFCARDNNNPLPLDGVLGLGSMGFSDIIYLYKRNFANYYPAEKLNALNEAGIHYQSIVPEDDTLAHEILSLVYDRIQSPQKGPIYLHCWNGWHMSGMIAAYTLMQFCDFNHADALKYWSLGADGNDKGYLKVKQRIAAFKKYPELEISLTEKLRVCPCIK
jgi:hypothetical protein